MHSGVFRKRASALLGGALFALFFAFGRQMEHDGASDPALAMAAALTIPFALILTALFERVWRRLFTQRELAGGACRPFRARMAFVALFACYVPMLLVTFPGSFAYDVPFQLRQVFTGEYSTHHPLLHTLLLGGCVALGRALGEINLGAALYTVLQMAGMAACFALTCASIARRCGARAARLSAAFFALYPLHMLFAVNATKDVLFSGAFALALALAAEAAEGESAPRGLFAGFTAACTAAMLLRNNAVYAVAVWMLLQLPALRRRQGRLLLLSAAISVGLALGTGALLARVTEAVSGDMSEMLSVPIQQLARARLMEGEKLTDEERETIDALMPGEAWRAYDPSISDPVKFAFDTEAMKADMGAAVSTYLSVLKKCPKAYLDALLALTYPFFYPYGEYRVSGYYLQMGISEEQLDQWCDFPYITSQSLFPRVRDSLAWRFGAKGAMQIPVVGYLFNMGAIVWVMLFFALRDVYRGRWRRAGVWLLPVLLWGTFLLGPVMAGRYIYPFVCVLPVMGSEKEDRS
ncbi:MAG: DUF6020 family protein [Clostridia bacterium]|nr:DUF6020 family protein [Clostridia bacterium]